VSDDVSRSGAEDGADPTPGDTLPLTRQQALDYRDLLATADKVADGHDAHTTLQRALACYELLENADDVAQAAIDGGDI